MGATKSSIGEKFVNENVCEIKHKNVLELASEAKTIALAAKKKAESPHECIKEDILEDLKGWKKWLRAGIFSLSITIVLGVTAWYTQRGEIDRHLVTQESNVKRIESSVDEIKRFQEELHVKFKYEKEQKKKQKREEIQAIKEAIIEVFNESSLSERRKSRKRHKKKDM
jgi:hypothetical protein